MDDDQVSRLGRNALLSSRVAPKKDSASGGGAAKQRSDWMIATVLGVKALIGDPKPDNTERSSSLVKLDISKCGQVPYKPGDHVELMPDLTSDSDRMDAISKFCENLVHNGKPLDPDMV